eukprot:8444618-Pyramimonas_sp.AAC.1
MFAVPPPCHPESPLPSLPLGSTLGEQLNLTHRRIGGNARAEDPLPGREHDLQHRRPLVLYPA